MLSSFTVVRESPASIRCFLNGQDTNGDVASVKMAAYDSNDPAQPVYTTSIPVAAQLAGQTSFHSFQLELPWTVGDQIELTLLDSHLPYPRQSQPVRMWVPGYGSGQAPVLNGLGRYRTTPDGACLTIAGADGSDPPNVAEYRVVLLAADGTPQAVRIMDASNVNGLSQFYTFQNINSVASAVNVSVSLVDESGNESDPQTVSLPPYNAGSPPSLASISWERPAPDSVRCWFSGNDPEGDEAIVQVDFMTGPNGTGSVAASVPVDFTQAPFMSVEFSGFGQVNGIPNIQSCRLTPRDTAGNMGKPTIANVPPTIGLGDADFDGSVTISDAIIALRMLNDVEPMNPGTVRLCDVATADGTPGSDGILTIDDVERLLRIAAGMEPLSPPD